MSAAIDVGGPTPKQTPYGRLTNFNTTATYTLSIKRDEDTGALWINSQDVRASMNPIFVYDTDILYLEAAARPTGVDYYTVQRLQAGTWTDVGNIGLANFQKRRKVILTITGTAATSTITITDRSPFPT